MLGCRYCAHLRLPDDNHSIRKKVPFTLIVLSERHFYTNDGRISKTRTKRVVEERSPDPGGEGGGGDGGGR